MPANDLILDARPARELTSREVAKLLGGHLGSLAGLARPETIEAAIQFYTDEKYRAKHREFFDGLWRQAVAQGFVIPDREQIYGEKK